MQRVLRLPCTSPSVLWRRPGEPHLQCQGHHCHWHHCQNHHCHCLPLTLVSLSPSSLCHLKIINVFSSCWNKPYPIYEVVTILRCLHLKQVLLTVTPSSSSPRQCHYHHIDPKNGQLWQTSDLIIWTLADFWFDHVNFGKISSDHVNFVRHLGPNGKSWRSWSRTRRLGERMAGSSTHYCHHLKLIINSP